MVDKFAGGGVMARIVDGTQVFRDACERIKQLEQLNATLAAEVDRARPVVEAAQVLTRSLRRHEPESWSGTEEALERAITAYEAAKEQG